MIQWWFAAITPSCSFDAQAAGDHSTPHGRDTRSRGGSQPRCPPSATIDTPPCAPDSGLKPQRVRSRDQRRSDARAYLLGVGEKRRLRDVLVGEQRQLVKAQLGGRRARRVVLHDVGDRQCTIIDRDEVKLS